MTALLRNGVDAKKTDKRGAVPFHLCCLYGHIEVVRVLLSHSDIELDMDGRDSAGKTALYLACENGHSEIAELLLQPQRVSVDEVSESKDDDDENEARESDGRKGADPNAADAKGRTPLFEAALNGHSECAQVLIRHGADVNQIADALRCLRRARTIDTMWLICCSKPMRM